jgi:hypothetical protein
LPTVAFARLSFEGAAFGSVWFEFFTTGTVRLRAGDLLTLAGLVDLDLGALDWGFVFMGRNRRKWYTRCVIRGGSLPALSLPAAAAMVPRVFTARAVAVARPLPAKAEVWV